MKLKNKMIIILTILITSIVCISTISLAAKYTPSKFGDAISSTDVNAGEIKDIGGQILGIIRVVGTIVAVGMLMIIGIKYMIGSAEEKAAYKKSLLPYIIGAILIFAASSLADLIYGWATNI
ncbi:MAG: hypothetical protein IJE59_01845 [Clostridia bacterium]|nr:hypothetical protein [Clostridia bacterium]